MSDLKRQDELIETVEPMHIVPFGTQGSVSQWNGVKPAKSRQEHSILFIGGPLDGQKLPMYADGRLHDHHTDPFDPESETYRYIPSLITFDGATKLVYVLFERLRESQKPSIAQELNRNLSQQKRLSNEP